MKEDAAKQQVIRTLGPFIDYYSGKSVRDLDFTDLERDIDQIALERALRLPANLAYLLRAGSSLEGIARTLQPNFSFVEAAKPFIQKWLLREPTAFGPLLKVFFRYGQEAYRNSAAKLTAGRDIFGFGKKKSKLISHSRTDSRKTPGHGDSAPVANLRSTGAKSPAAGKDEAVAKAPSRDSHGKASENQAKTIQASESNKTEVLAANEAEKKIETRTRRSPSTSGAAEKLAQTREAAERTSAHFRQQIYLLETKLKKSYAQQITLSVCGLVVVFLLFLESYLPQSRSYANYFLIGNGLMGAIIMWHLVVLLGKAFQDRR